MYQEIRINSFEENGKKIDYQESYSDGFYTVIIEIIDSKWKLYVLKNGCNIKKELMLFNSENKAKIQFLKLVKNIKNNKLDFDNLKQLKENKVNI